VIPASQLDPVALNFTKAFLPLPNSPSNIYSYNLSVPTNDNQVITKIDHSITNANRIFSATSGMTITPFRTQSCLLLIPEQLGHTQRNHQRHTHLFTNVGKYRGSHGCAEYLYS
jgi:hypothetical protein